MSQNLTDLIEQHERQLNSLNRQRHWWLWASSVVFTGIIFTIFSWEWLDNLESKTIWWVIVSLMLIVSINWWYWTMRVVRIVITHQSLEYRILKSILKDVRLVRKEFKKFKTSYLDLIK